MTTLARQSDIPGEATPIPQLIEEIEAEGLAAVLFSRGITDETLWDLAAALEGAPVLAAHTDAACAEILRLSVS